MANRKAKPCDDWEFLPQRLQESTKLDISEKNVVAALCYFRMRYRNYAKENDGWFYTKQIELEEESNVKHAQLNRILLKFELNGTIQRKSGSTNHPTHYKLHPIIEELLLQKCNDTHVSLSNDTHVSLSNDTKVVETPKIVEKIANDTQDKIREDKKRQDKSFLISSLSNSIESNNNVVEFGKIKEEDFSIQQKFNSREFYYKWIEVFRASKNEEEITENLRRAAFSLPSDFKKDTYIERLQDEYNILKAHLHWKKSK
jgi:hypothetical protein